MVGSVLVTRACGYGIDVTCGCRASGCSIDVSLWL